MNVGAVGGGTSFSSVEKEVGGGWFREQRWGVSQLLCVAPNVPLQDDEEVSEFALDGLKQVMAIKSRVVLPYLVPKVNPARAQKPQPRHRPWAHQEDQF